MSRAIGVRPAPFVDEHLDLRTPNTTPTPNDMPDLDSVDLTATTVAEEIALATKYEKVLWNTGDRHDSLQCLQNFWTGATDPASDQVRRSTLNKLCRDLPATTRLTLVRTFDEMGTLASWICYGDNHAWLDPISVSAAQQLRDARRHRRTASQGNLSSMILSEPW